jgi:hypothetical protein
MSWVPGTLEASVDGGGKMYEIDKVENGPENPVAESSADGAKSLKLKRASDRLDIVHEQVDLLRADAAERRRSVDGKASFLAITSGVLIAASASKAAEDSSSWQILQVALTVLALVFAALATLPESRRELSAVRLGDKYLDSEKSAALIYREILESKIYAMSAQEAVLRRRGTLVGIGFSCLIASSTIYVFIQFSN